MNFFEQQDRARRSTFWLVFLFSLAVVAIVVAVNVAVLGVLMIVNDNARAHRRGPFYPGYEELDRSRRFGDFTTTELSLGISGATLAIIVGGSLYKIAALSRGGHAVAQMMGGRLVTSNATEAREAQLVNVVEEMSIASGVPVPGIYVLEGESAINAFAAGFSPADSVVAVTRGTLDTLSRDELQGVIGHEFSHLLNGDTRLNLRLIGVLNGILVIGLIGYYTLNSLRYMRTSSSSSRGKDKGGRAIIVIILLGLSLLVIGYVGVFFATLIQAAVCRSREFLADASSVQFTRNPGGIVGALKKIGGGESLGRRGASVLENSNAMQVAHMFFARGVSMSLMRLTSTHPPIEDRIRAIDPTWDGRFIPDLRIVQDGQESPEPPPLPGMAFSGGVRADHIVRRVGAPLPQHVSYAAALLRDMPADIVAWAREPFNARAIVFCLLLVDDQAGASRQIELLSRYADPATVASTQQVLPRVAALGPRARLPLLDISIPALRQLSAVQLDDFKRALRALIQADARVTMNEYVLFKIVDWTLKRPDDPARRQIVRYAALKPVIPDIAVLISSLAQAGNSDASSAKTAFDEGMARLGVDEIPATPPETDLNALDQALGRLAACAPGVKRRIIDAAAYCVAADGMIQLSEAELLRAVAATLDCPLPPLVAPRE